MSNRTLDDKGVMKDDRCDFLSTDISAIAIPSSQTSAFSNWVSGDVIKIDNLYDTSLPASLT